MLRPVMAAALAVGVPIGDEGFHALSIAPRGGTAWAVGEQGRIAALKLAPRAGFDYAIAARGSMRTVAASTASITK